MIDAAWVALSLAEHVGGKKLRALVAHFGSASAVLDADEKALRQVPGIGPKIAGIIRAISLDAVEKAIPRWQDAGVTIMPLDDPLYPSRLKQVDDAPPTLFVRGALPFDHWRTVAVVGTRSPRPEMRATAERFGLELARRGCVVVSGLAYGIDEAAHIGALASSDGYTTAVLGSGVLSIYPRPNAALAQTVMARGAVVSEVHPNASPNPSALVARNRLTSGLSDAVIIVETAIDGGSMHAARRAWDQGCVVYAVDNGATGNQALIAAGAVPLDESLRGFDWQGG